MTRICSRCKPWAVQVCDGQGRGIRTHWLGQGPIHSLRTKCSDSRTALTTCTFQGIKGGWQLSDGSFSETTRTESAPTLRFEQADWEGTYLNSNQHCKLQHHLCLCSTQASSNKPFIVRFSCQQHFFSSASLCRDQFPASFPPPLGHIGQSTGFARAGKLFVHSLKVSHSVIRYQVLPPSPFSLLPSLLLLSCPQFLRRFQANII